MTSRWTALVLAAIGFLLVSSPALADTTILRPNGSPATNWQRIADRSRVSTPDATIRISRDVRGVCGRWRGLGGCAVGGANLIALDRGEGPWTFYHELGHLFDFTRLTDFWHGEFTKLFKEPERAWSDPTTEYDLIEVFANVYRWCAAGKPLRGWFWRNYTWGTGIDLTRWQVRTGCRMIRQAAR